jgi:hypothetical protein
MMEIWILQERMNQRLCYEQIVDKLVQNFLAFYGTCVDESPPTDTTVSSTQVPFHLSNNFP